MIPDALAPLAEMAVWVAWNMENGRKVPKSPFGGNAASNRPDSWGTYKEAEQAMMEHGYTGVGVMLSEGITGIDLDHAIDEDGNIKPWAQEIVDSIGSYTEVSPSGEGLHILCEVDPQDTGPIGRADHRTGLEVYNHGRYFTVTGEQIAGAAVETRTDEVRKLVEGHFKSPSQEDRMRQAVRDMARDQVGRRANETIRENARRDGLKYARVPMGGETCSFCLMLAGRGFVYKSAETAGEGNHYHRSCRCRVVPGFDGMEVEGYDPNVYAQDYENARDALGDGAGAKQIVREMDRQRE